jgi:hypothetical protein
MRTYNVEINGVCLDVEAQVFESPKEPYSWGQGRGVEYDVDIIHIYHKDEDIMELLSDEQIQEVMKQIEEGCI